MLVVFALYTYRSKYIGVVFQSYNLLTKYTALENVVLSMDIAGYKTENKNKRAAAASVLDFFICRIDKKNKFDIIGKNG